MRKQYHFRPSEQGLQAWDVHRLVELSKKIPVIDIPIIEIRELDEAHWAHNGRDLTCRQIAEHAKLIHEVDFNFPIILFTDGRVADGMHRVCKAWMEGKAKINAVRFEIDPKPDYIGVSPEDLPYEPNA